MLYRYKTLYPSKNDRIKDDAFNRVATRLTQTQQKSMRALDYHLTDLLHEARDRIKGIINDLSTGDNDSTSTLLQHVDLVYSTIQHTYPTLIGSTDLAPHNIGFGIGSNTANVSKGKCEICATILRFFDVRLPNALDGKVGEHYIDIIEHARDKVLLYMGHSMRCVAQQQRINILINSSEGDPLTIIMD